MIRMVMVLALAAALAACSDNPAGLTGPTGNGVGSQTLPTGSPRKPQFGEPTPEQPSVDGSPLDRTNDGTFGAPKKVF